MKLPEVVLFDLDGTLIDSSEIVVDAYHEAMVALDYDPPSRDLIAGLAGKSTHETAKGMGAKESEYDWIDEYFWDYFGRYAEQADDVPLYDGVTECLETLHKRGIRMGIVTSNEGRSARLLMQHADLDKYFEVYVGKEHLEQRKPSPAPLYLALKKLDYTGTEIWFVGDTVHDVHAAQTAGITSVAIPRPTTYVEVVNSEPDYLLSAFSDLLPLITQLNNA